MKDYVAVIAAVVAGVFAAISAVIAWKLKAFSTKQDREIALRKEKYEELKSVYTGSFSLFEDTVKRILNSEEHTLGPEWSRTNAAIHLLAPENIVGEYTLACLVLEEWSELHAKATPRRIKDGDGTCIILQAPDPTKDFKEPARRKYDQLQDEMQRLFSLMRTDLETHRCQEARG